MTSIPTRKQVVVVGGGPGGYAAAFAAADLDLQVTLIDPAANPGGVCLYRGCIPSKALLHVAKVVSEAKAAAAFGVTFQPPAIDLAKLRQWKEEVVQKLTDGLGVLTKQRKIEYLQGHATLLDAHTMQVQRSDGSDLTINFDYAILAAGSQPAIVPSLASDSPLIMDSSGALALPDIPDSLLVVGGGYIGLELGTVYAALGTQVTVVEMTDRLLPGADRDLVTFLQRRLEQEFAAIRLQTRVRSLSAGPNGVNAVLESGGDGSVQSVEFSRVLVAIGRRPTTGGLGLENTRIQLDSRGFVQVDTERRTAEPHIFAIGDMAGEPMLAHKAAHEGRVAAEVIAGRKAVFAPMAIPAVVFTDPEIAWCGLTETAARAAGRKVTVTRFPWAASGRAATMGRADGVTKLVVDPDTQRVLGVGIAGPGAGELIAEGVLAVEMAAVAEDIKLSIHAHPTLSETLMEAAEAVYGSSTHSYRPRRR